MSTLFQTHTGRLYRRPAPTMEFGTPADDDFVFHLAFPCRLSLESGLEQVDSRTNAKPQTRTGTLFVLPSSGFEIMRGDQIAVDQFPGRRFEIELVRAIWNGDSFHHWELSVNQVEGN